MNKNFDRPLYFDRQPVTDFDALVACYDQDEFSSPYRSTVPLLSLVKGGAPVLDDLLHRLGIDLGAGLHFEYRTDVAKGLGRPSQTDLMVSTATVVCAIEAKWTEPRYATVSKWIRDTKDSANRVAVMEGWLSLIQRYAKRPLTPDDMYRCVYQLVHRAASACAASSPSATPAMAYLTFHTKAEPKDRHTVDYKADLKAFHRTLGSPDAFPLYLIQIELEPTSAFYALAPLRKAKDSTYQEVRYGLCDETLFAFGSASVERIMSH